MTELRPPDHNKYLQTIAYGALVEAELPCALSGLRGGGLLVRNTKPVYTLRTGLHLLLD